MAAIVVAHQQASGATVAQRTVRQELTGARPSRRAPVTLLVRRPIVYRPGARQIVVLSVASRRRYQWPAVVGQGRAAQQPTLRTPWPAKIVVTPIARRRWGPVIGGQGRAAQQPTLRRPWQTVLVRGAVPRGRGLRGGPVVGRAPFVQPVVAGRPRQFVVGVTRARVMWRPVTVGRGRTSQQPTLRVPWAAKVVVSARRRSGTTVIVWRPVAVVAGVVARAPWLPVMVVSRVAARRRAVGVVGNAVGRNMLMPKPPVVVPRYAQRRDARVVGRNNVGRNMLMPKPPVVVSGATRRKVPPNVVVSRPPPIVLVVALRSAAAIILRGGGITKRGVAKVLWWRAASGQTVFAGPAAIACAHGTVAVSAGVVAGSTVTGC